jgi:two-component system phosphate regulon sensor histidine kinase PhoR
MADGLMIADQASIVRLINPAAARLLGLGPSDAEGRSIIEVLRDHELASLVAETVTTDAGVAGPRLIELSSHRANRAVRTIASRVPALRGAGHRVVLLLQDVTELQRAETIRREFVANVSHELRTPVAALKALVETLEDGAIDDRPAALDFLHRMRIEVDGLAQLVEELLQLSRIEAGQLPLRLLPVDLSAVVLAAVERLRQQAERAHVELHVEATEGLPPARADPDRIHQIVLNLVHNALKFTPPGGRVAVQVCAVPEGLAVRVADTGIGIAAETQPRLFERFYKADSARSSGGTGLGLAIAKHLVQAHGGQIGVESPGEGRGATFTFTIPIAKDG